MKGKGKGKEQNDTKDCPLQYPDLTPFEHTASCYSSIIEQKGNKDITLDELDELQFELEKMLLAVGNRQDVLEEELKVLTTWQEKKNKPPVKEVESSSKKGTSEEKQGKKYKKNSSKAHTPAPVGRPKSQSLQINRLQEQPVITKQQRNDAPNRFWDSLKPYSADITKEHLKFLEEWAKPDDEAEYRIPPLGKHYTSEWTSKDVQEEEQEGTKPNEKSKSLGSSSSLNSNDYEKNAKRMKKEHESEEPCPFGPLTQRLVSCLIEENIMTPLEDTIDASKDVPVEDSDHGNGSIIKSLNIGDPEELEKRIRRNLEVVGILQPDKMEVDEENPEDEVLSELKKVQSNLRAITRYNLSQKQRLLKLAREEVARQEIRRKLDMVDAAIVDLHSKSKALKQKKGSLSEKEREHALNLLKERELLVKQIEPEEES